MYAIVEIAGKQYRVEKDKYLYTDLLKVNEGDNVTFEKILLYEDDSGNVKVGDPILNDIKVKAKVLAHVKGDKIIVFKKKRRKGYQKKNGHRQLYSKVLIENIE
jgi:large subunit ribosomal protein L21